jgi:tetratricopeptide (TPR) repeat protein
MKPFWVIAALIAAVFISYGNTLHGQFIYDDRAIIVKNPLIQNLGHVPTLFRTPYWGMQIGQPQEYKGALYRPLTVTTYALNYAAGKLNPFGYHLVNLLLHLAACLLLWALCLQWGWNRETSAAAALLFTVLPIHTEAVSNIVGRAEILTAFFVLLSWNLVAKKSGWGKIILGALAFGGALLSKENAVAFLPVLIVTDLVLAEKSWKETGRERFLLWVVYGGALGLYLEWRYLLFGKALATGAIPYFSSQPLIIIALTMAKFILKHYLMPLFIGVGFCAEFTRPVIADASAFDGRGWISLIFLLGVVSLSILYAFKRKSTKALGALIFFGFLFPVLNVAARIEVIGAERFLYLPSIGFCMTLGLLFGDALSAAKNNRAGVSALFAALLLWYGWKTIDRNHVWQTEENFWETTVQDAPQSPRAWNGIGLVRMKQGQFDEAIEDFKKALSLNSFLGDAYINIAECYYFKGNFTKAKRVFSDFAQFKPYDPDMLFYLGMIAEQEHDNRKALDYYAKATAVNPFNPTARQRLSLIEDRIRQRAGEVQP